MYKPYTYRSLHVLHLYKPYTYRALHGNKYSKRKFQKNRIRNFLSRFLPFLYSNIHFRKMEHELNLSFKLNYMKWEPRLCVCFKILFFFVFLVLGSKIYFLLISFIVLTIASPLNWGSLDLSFFSNITHHSIGNKHRDRTLTYVPFSIHNTSCHTTLFRKCFQNLRLLFTLHDKLWLPIADTQRVKFITQIKTVRSAIKCACVECISG